MYIARSIWFQPLTSVITCIFIFVEFDWRNADVYHSIENEGYSNIHIIPFRDLTLPLFNMHPSVSSSSSSGGGGGGSDGVGSTSGMSSVSSMASGSGYGYESHDSSSAGGADNITYSEKRKKDKAQPLPPRAPDSQDCTHYCYFPQMWQSVWYHLHLGALGSPTATSAAVAPHRKRQWM